MGGVRRIRPRGTRRRWSADGDVRKPGNIWHRLSDEARCVALLGGVLLLCVGAGLAAYGGHRYAHGLDGGVDRFTGVERELAYIAAFSIHGCSGEPAIHKWAWKVTEIQVLPGQVFDREGKAYPAFRAKVRSYNFIGIPTGTTEAGWTPERGPWPTSGWECREPDW